MTAQNVRKHSPYLAWCCLYLGCNLNLLPFFPSTRICHILKESLSMYVYNVRRSQYPRGLRRRSKAARLLRSRARIPPGACMSVCCVCCVLSGRGLCDGLITRPEESYRKWRVVVCDQETSKTRRL